MQLITIDGTSVEVMNYKWSKKELDVDSGRNLKGKMERNILQHHPVTIDIVFPPQNGQERSQTLSLLDNPKMLVSALNPKTNSITSHYMMHGDLNTELYWNVVDSNNNDEILYNPFTVQLVEY